MNNLKRQRISLILLSLVILLIAASLLYIGMKFYDDKQMYIVVRTYNGDKYYSINKYSIKQQDNFSILIYDRSSDEKILYRGWEYKDFELIEKQNMSGK